MKALIYKNTKTTIPRFIDPLHSFHPNGYAYKSIMGHYVHLYGDNKNLWTISQGLTVTEKSNNTIEEWIEKTFGAEEVVYSKNNIGETIAGVWRPGLYFYEEVIQGLAIDVQQRYSDEQALAILIDKLSDILLYVEPDKNTLSVYSHKIRELLLASCTEVDNLLQRYARQADLQPENRNFTMKDYKKLASALFLAEYQVELKPFNQIKVFKPFENWNTNSLKWYEDYNKTKHNRDEYFCVATLENCIYALAATITLFVVRYGPYYLLESGNRLSTLFNELFTIKLDSPDPRSFYIPKINISNDHRCDLLIYNGNRGLVKWDVHQLRI